MKLDKNILAKKKSIYEDYKKSQVQPDSPLFANQKANAQNASASAASAPVNPNVKGAGK